MRKEIFKIKKGWLLEASRKNQVIDFYETFSPVARLETIRTVIVVAAEKKWKIL